MIGPGKYDQICTYVREETKSSGAIVIVLNGEKGSGFSCQAPPNISIALPQILRSVADEIDKTGI